MKIQSTFVKFAGIGLLGVGIAGLGVASAVNLGLEANNTLSAGTSISASCQASTDPKITVDFSEPAYNAAAKTFTVSNVLLGSVVSACAGLDYDVVVADASGAALSTSSGIVAANTTSAKLASNVDAALVASVTVVIK